MSEYTDKWVSECGSVTLICGDCLQVLPTLESESVDAVITDPPYLNLKGGYSFPDAGGVANKIQESLSIGDKWGASLAWCEDARRIARYGLVVFCCYADVAEIAAAFRSCRRAALLTWHKRNAPPTGKNIPRFTEEYAWGFAKAPGLQWDGFAQTMIDVPKLATGAFCSPERIVDENNRAVHEAQKPIAVMRWIVDALSPSSVCDMFMGTGTTGIACIRAGASFIGIERDPEYFAIARARIQRELETKKRCPMLPGMAVA